MKVSRITALSDDIALNLAAVSVRIEAPIPGKAAVGVEVPNDHIETVPLRDVLESGECRRHPSRLAVALGRDNAGRYVIADLAKMPPRAHRRADRLGQIGVHQLHHLFHPLPGHPGRGAPDHDRPQGGGAKLLQRHSPPTGAGGHRSQEGGPAPLEWAVNEMTQRYKKFAQLGVRDMKG